MANKTHDPSTQASGGAKQKRQLLEQKLIHAMTPGVVVELEPEAAKVLGLIEDHSMSEEDARGRVLDAMAHEPTAFIDDGTVLEIPTFITVTHACTESDAGQVQIVNHQELFTRPRPLR